MPEKTITVQTALTEEQVAAARALNASGFGYGSILALLRLECSRATVARACRRDTYADQRNPLPDRHQRLAEAVFHQDKAALAAVAAETRLTQIELVKGVRAKCDVLLRDLQ